jgi:hypothetical protein
MIQFVNFRSALLRCIFAFYSVLYWHYVPIAHAQSDAKAVFADWTDWISRVQECSSVKIVEQREGVDETKANVIFCGSELEKNLHRSLQFHSAFGLMKNFTVGNKDYLFSLREHKGKVEVASLTLRTESNFETAYADLLNNNALSTMCLLTGSSDSIHPLVVVGKVLKSEFPDNNSANFTVEVADSFEGARFQPVKLAFSRAEGSKWYPREVAWKVDYKDGSNLASTYSYHDWVDRKGLRVPTRIKALRSNNKTTDIKIVFDLTEDELKEVKRFRLSDFGLPEPKIDTSVPMWVWGMIAGIALLVIALVMKMKGF